MKKIILISVLIFGLAGGVFAQTETKIESKVVPVPLPQSSIEAQPPIPEKIEAQKIEVELKKSTEIKKPISGCKDLCGDGICQKIVCMAIGCPCAETPENCPQDCKKEKESLPTLPVIQLPSATKVEINPIAEKPVLIEDKVLEVKGLEAKEMPKISIEVQTPAMKETTVQIEIDKEKKLINIEHENVIAQTVHQIKVEEKTLKIETPKGEISVNVLPSLATKVVIQKEPQKIEKISLEVKNEIPVYQTKGIKSEKFLGIIPVQIPVQTEVSAHSGEIMKIQKPILMKILDFFSF